MSLRRIYERLIESPTDPTLDPLNIVRAESLWLNTSRTPQVLYQRNDANTAWVRIDAIRGSVTVTISTGADTWEGTVNDSDVKAGQQVKLQVLNSNNLLAFFHPEWVASADGSFSWRVYATKKLFTGTFYLHWEVSP